MSRALGDVDILPESDAFPDAPHPRLAQHLYGQDEAERTLLDAYRSGRLPHAWIIGGREGVGKATLAWRFARFILSHPDPSSAQVQAASDLHVAPEHPVARRVAALSHGDLTVLRREWDTKTKKHFTEIRIEDVRRMFDLFHMSAAEGGWRVVIIDCIDDVNRSSANALLKMIEEPPQRSLFLLLSHSPARVLATLRSRSRILQLPLLSPPDIEKAMRAAGAPWSQMTQDDLDGAAKRGQGSVREAMRLLSGRGLALSRRLEDVLASLPEIDWTIVHEIADSVVGRDGSDDFETTLATLFDWMDRRVRSSDAPAARLAPLAEVWEKIAASAREIEAFNLDRRPFILSTFADLAAAARAARS